MPFLPNNLPAKVRRAATAKAAAALAAAQNPSALSASAIAQHMAGRQGALLRPFAHKDALLRGGQQVLARGRTPPASLPRTMKTSSPPSSACRPSATA